MAKAGEGVALCLHCHHDLCAPVFRKHGPPCLAYHPRLKDWRAIERGAVGEEGEWER